MTLEDVIYYEKIDLSRDINQVDQASFKKDVEFLFGEYIGEFILIPFSDLPAWHLMLIFEYLRKNTPEIALETSDRELTVIYTIVSDEKYARHENTHVYPELFTLITEKPKKREPEIIFDLSKIEYKNKEVIDIILSIKQKVAFTDKLVFVNSKDNITALLAYAIWLPFANSVEYREDNKSIIIR
ncbi:MAG: hypothetical protein Q8P20_08115 [bacterium]|nr:hypothetical protein [bacterium]